MKTITFKPEFEDKLKKLKIKTKFVKNIKEDCKRDNDVLYVHLNYLNEVDSWRELIYTAFVWGYSPEGHKYWSDISYN